MSSLSAPIPVLRSFSEVKAKEFYLEYLEFQLDWEHRFEPHLPLYMQISKGKCILHISEHHGDACPGSSLRIETKNLNEFQDLLVAKIYPLKPGIEQRPWGQDMSITDPFGNRLIFSTLNR